MAASIPHVAQLAPAPCATAVADAEKRATPDFLTPVRLGERERLGRLVARSITGARSSQEAVARALSCSRTNVQKLLDGRAPLQAWHLLHLPPRVLSCLAQQIDALADGTDADSGVTLERHVVTLTRELGDVAGLDGDDLDRVEKELVELDRATRRALVDVRARRERSAK